MKRRRLALLLAVIMTVASFDSTAIMASGADFSSEAPASEELSVQTEESQPEVEESESVELSDSDENFSADMEVHESNEEQLVFDDSVDTEEQTDTEAESVEFSDGQLVQITAAKANMEDVRTKFYSGMERICLDGCSIDVSYKNGETENIVLDGYSEVEDSYGNMFGYKFGEQNGKYAYPMGSALSPGVYNLIFTVNDEKLDIGAAYTITVGKPEPSELRELQPGLNKEIYSPKNSFAWYYFIPKYTGNYFIGPSNTMAVYYEDNVYDWMDEVKGQYGGGGRSYVLSEGVTYYIGFSGSIYDTDIWKYTNTFDVTITNNTLTGLSYSESEITLLNGVDDLGPSGKLPSGKLTVQYNGTEEEEPPMLGFAIQDSHGNTIRTRIVGSDGEEFTFSANDEGQINDLPVGTYTLSFIYRDADSGETLIESEPVKLTVRNPKVSDFRELKVGECNEDVEYSYNDEGMRKDSEAVWYVLNVQEAGTYQFRKYENGRSYEAYTSASWRRFHEDGTLSLAEISGETSDSYYLEAGTYLVSFYAHGANMPIKLDVEISRTRHVEKTEIVSAKPENPVYIARVEEAYLEDLTVRVTYDDGTTKEYSLSGDNNDEEGRALRYDIYRRTEPDEHYDEDYIEVYDPYLYADRNYIFRVKFGEQNIGDIPITVRTIEECVNEEITADGETELNNQDKLVVKYTAAQTGRYEFSFNVPVHVVTMRTQRGGTPESLYMSGNHCFANLKAGTTYYLYVDADEYCEKLKVSVSVVTRPESLTVKALKTNYLAGIDAFDGTGVEVKVDYSNHTSGTVRGNASAGGYEINYRVQDEEGNRYRNDEGLTVGTWTVTPYLSVGTASGSSIAVDKQNIPVTSTTITAGFLDLSTLPSLGENKWMDVPKLGVSYTNCSFTPTRTGMYTWETKDNSYGLNVEFYRQGKQKYECFDSGIVNLNAGETYLVRIRLSSYRNSKAWMPIKILPYSSSEYELTGDLELDVGMKKTVALNNALNDVERYMDATFTPAETALYKFEALNYGEKYIDTAVELYEDGRYITTDNEEGNNVNFSLIYQLEEGRKYTYRVRASRGPGLSIPFIVSFDKVSGNTIKSAKLVLKDGKKAEDLDVTKSIGEFYQIEITYEDGQTALYELGYPPQDIYGNWISSEIKSVKDIQDDFECEVQIRCAEWADRNAADQARYSEKVPVKGLNSVTHIKLNREYANTTNEYGAFIFVPDAEGEYIYTGQSKNEASVWEIRGYDNGELKLTEADISQNGRVTEYSLNAKKGCLYLIRLYEKDDAFTLQKAKKLNGLELLEAPKQSICLPGSVNTVSMKGLKVRASYTDGTTEDLTYGTPDSSGRYLYADEIEWLDGKTGKAYVGLGKYRVSFTVHIDSESCSCEEISRVEATCGAEGKVIYRCRTHGDTKEEILKATGKHTMGRWKVTSGPTAVAEGMQERRCTVCGKKETAKIAKLNFTVRLNVATGKTLPLKVKQSFQVKASGLAKGDKVASWKSNNTRVATVSKTGKIVGKKAGMATITMKFASGNSVWFRVKVQKSTVATTSLKVVNKATGKTIKSATLKAKKKLTLVTTIAPVTSKQKVTYSSSNKKIATVSSKGVITAKKKGVVTITVKSGKKSVKVKIKVTK